MIMAIASQQLLSLRRQRTFLVFLGTLLVMTALAGVLGWSSHRTIIKVYNEAVQLLTAEGKQAPPNPFDAKPRLSLLSNMVMYIPLIGALMAVVLGHIASADDQTTGIARLVFSRQVPRRSYVAGRVLGCAIALALILVASLLVSWVSLLVVNRQALPPGDSGRLAMFYGLSWLYLMVFALVGMVTMLFNRRRSLGLLTGIGTWLVITFVVPQFTSGLRPTASLNPITDPVSTSQTFFKITSKARPWSISEQYRQTSGRILETATSESGAATFRRIAPIAAVLIGLIALSIQLVRRHDYSRSATGD
jgi:ABC-type transport system involved in multi-copper enzyme maturation permease subunit